MSYATPASFGSNENEVIRFKQQQTSHALVYLYPIQIKRKPSPKYTRLVTWCERMRKKRSQIPFKFLCMRRRTFVKPKSTVLSPDPSLKPVRSASCLDEKEVGNPKDAFAASEDEARRGKHSESSTRELAPNGLRIRDTERMMVQIEIKMAGPEVK